MKRGIKCLEISKYLIDYISYFYNIMLIVVCGNQVQCHHDLNTILKNNNKL